MDLKAIKTKYPQTVPVAEEAFGDACQEDAGWCPACRDFTHESTEPDACGYECPECGEPVVVGAEDALLAGLLTFTSTSANADETGATP
jgi:hypothetical protein